VGSESADVGTAIERLVQTVESVTLPSITSRRRIRVDAGLSLREVASALNVHPMTVLRWERGATPRREHAASYRRLLDELVAIS
jgi:DNA-binding transcriptional regulator YiaG